MKVVFSEQAARDLESAARFYADRSSTSLGQAFVDAVEQACIVLGEQPQMGAPWRHSTRRLVLRRFPFNVIYLIQPEEVQVIAIAHHRRSPGYWVS